MRPEIIGEKPVTLSEAKSDLSFIKARDGELSFRSTKTEEYLAQFAPIEEKKAQELFKKIDALHVPRLKDSHICKIIDVTPVNLTEIKAILQGYTLTIKDENLKKILEVLNEAIKTSQ